MEQLIAYFLKKGVTESELPQIGEAFKFKKIPRGGFFAEEGKTSKYLAFITKGLFQYFFLKDGKELTTYVTGQNTFLASVSSFFKQRPSKEYVRALTDAELWMIHYNDLATLKVQSEGFKNFYIEALENVVAGIDESRSNLIILNAEERYATLLREEACLAAADTFTIPRIHTWCNPKAFKPHP